MNCLICETELIDGLGLFCPNEDCCYITEIPNVVNEKDIIPLLYENGKLIKWIKTYGHADNPKYWYYDGKLHREDGPAVESKYSFSYWSFGKRHREDGPAVEYANGYKEWWLNDKRHRIDGPAIEWNDGTKHWYLNGELHREDGPAVECANGDKEWWLNGQLKNEKL